MTESSTKWGAGDRHPETSGAIAEVVDGGGELGLEHRPLVQKCRDLEDRLAYARAVLDEALGKNPVIFGVDKAAPGGDKTVEFEVVMGPDLRQIIPFECVCPRCSVRHGIKVKPGKSPSF